MGHPASGTERRWGRRGVSTLRSIGALVSLLTGVASATGCETTTLPPARDGGADQVAVDRPSIDGDDLDVPQKIDVVSVDVVAVDVVQVSVFAACRTLDATLAP
jgi:hypothetical protein